MTVETAEAGTDKTMFSTRETPWMKLGKIVEDTKTAAEAAELGGLNFSVEQRPLWFGDHTDLDIALPAKRITSRVANVRTDTGELLSIVSKDYPVLQYSEAFDFMDQINPTYVAAGCLKGGRQGFMVVKASQYAIDILGGDDPHDMFIVLRTSHDCSRAVEASVMPLRNRCMNQLPLNTFAKSAKLRWAIKHTSTMSAKLAEAQESLVNLQNYGAAFNELVSRLVDVKVTSDKAIETLKFVLPDRPKRASNIDRIIQSWETSPTNGFARTGWGLVNAVSEDFEWVRQGGTYESRFVGALQGSLHRAINRTTSYVLTSL